MQVSQSALNQPSIHEMKEWELTDKICQLPLSTYLMMSNMSWLDRAWH